jgi:hypothetical protein
MADRRDAVVAPGSAQLTTIASNAFDCAAPFQERLLSEQARFRIAPKTSPPA